MTDASSPVRPRDAATLVIHRESTLGLEVLMGRRSDKARFKPGVYVFPGGGLEAADRRVQGGSALHPSIAPRLAVGNSQERAHALALAAIRETFEECGLRVGVPGDIGDNPHASWQDYRRHGITPPLGELRYLGRAITPSPQPIRFHARFFAIDAKFVEGEADDTHELGDLQWVAVTAVKTLNVMPVTLLMLEALTRQLEQGDPRAAFLSFQHGKRQILWV
jgi:8-oxo-dGTP pyrophosphatase MutT (NUDIX family)